MLGTDKCLSFFVCRSIPPVRQLHIIENVNVRSKMIGMITSERCFIRATDTLSGPGGLSYKSHTTRSNAIV